MDVTATTGLVFGAAQQKHGLQKAGFEPDRNQRTRGVREWAERTIRAYERLGGASLITAQTLFESSDDPKLAVATQELRADLEALRAAVADLEADQAQRFGVTTLSRNFAKDLVDRYSAALDGATGKAKEWLAIAALFLGEDDYLSLGYRAFQKLHWAPGDFKGPTVSADDLLK
ncbi:MAG: hypothetical protein WKG00_01800 [Polyangiaceae bacterium]